MISFIYLLADISSRDPYFTLLLGGFNAKSTTWCINSQHKIEGTQFQSLTLLYEMKQLYV